MLPRAPFLRLHASPRARTARRTLVGAVVAVGLAACADHAPTAPTESVAAPEASAAIAASTTAPVCYTEDFAEFVHGQNVSAVATGPLALSVSTIAFRNNAATNVAHTAMAFDTDHVSLSANDGTDMEWSGTYRRCPGCQGLGKLLVVRRYGSAAILDNNPGGEMTFTGFPAGAYWVKSYTVVDNDTYELPVSLSVDGVVVAGSVPTGDGSVQTVTVGGIFPILHDVAFTLGTAAQDSRLGSGGIDNVTFCTIPPHAGCTRTPGYWKNHESVLALYLPQWLGTPGGVASEHVTSVSQAVAILSSSDENGIRKLRVHLLATKLNVAAGASPTSIASTIAAADLFLATHGVASWTSLSEAQRGQVLAWKDALDAYNNGRVGPPKCG